MNDNFLNKVGLTYLWNKIKDAFVSKKGDTMTGTLTFTNGNVNLNHKSGKVYTQDSTGFTYPMIHDNGTNMWIGSQATKAQHHRGGTYISTGYNGTKGYDSIYVSVPNADNTNASNYLVYHTGYKPNKSAVGLGNVDNTSDLDKPISTATQSALDLKADKTEIPENTSDLINDSNFVSDSSYIHTDNNFTTTLKDKLDGISSGAEVNVQANWNTTDTTDDSYIQNKPTIPTTTSELTNNSGFIDNTVNNLTNYTTTTDMNTALDGKVNKTDIATDTTYGIVKLNPSESVTLNSNGQLDVGGRLGQFTGTTGVYNPKTISPNIVKDGSFLLTEASGTSLGSKSLAVSTGSSFTLKVAASAGATQYEVANTYVNRILCAGAVNGVVALDEASAATKTVNIVSVQINGADFTPDSSANDSANNIIVTVDESLNPDSVLAKNTNIRMYYDEGKSGGFSNLFVGQGVGGIGGASVIVGQRVYAKSGNACALIGADIFNQGNGNTVVGRQHISRKNRWFIAGTGHDNTSGKSEVGAVFGQWSNITANTVFAVGNGTSQTNRSNTFEILTDGRVKSNGTPTENDDLTTKAYVDSAIGGGGLNVTTYGNADFTYNTGFTAYSTTTGNANEPRATKYGRMINLTGAFKSTEAQTGTSAVAIGKVPAGCEPLYQQSLREQGSGQNSYLMEILTDGTIRASRYGVGTNTAIPNNAWLNINITYISKS